VQPNDNGPARISIKMGANYPFGGKVVDQGFGFMHNAVVL
jgi:hypothetical protein